jgi:L-2,4-diaminobutyrate decarboxylase
MDPLGEVRAAFAPGRFREDGRALIDQLAGYLERALGAAPMAVLPWREPAAQLERWATSFPAPTTLVALLERVVAESIHLHHPRYVGHQVTPPLPAAALCDLVGSLLNNSMAVYEMGPVGTALERHGVRFLAEALGLPAGAGGVLTSGGSAGNLTALLAARQASAGFDIWNAGGAGGPPLAVLCSTEAHYSVARALRIMGFGAEGAWPVPVDERFRLRPEALPEVRRAAERAGRRVIAVVASAGATATGAFDPLAPIADFCAAEQLWFHVDGAHGASAALAPELRGRLAGIERADSVVWDTHKLMLMPALCTAVLFRDGRRAHQAFAQEASYLFAEHGDAEPPWFDIATRTLECTKLMMGLKLYAALALHGPAFFGAYVTGMFALAARFAERVATAPDFQLAVAPDCNIVCFRHVPVGLAAAELDELQARVRRRLIADGGFYLVQTRLPAGVFLRVTLLNPFTTLDDLTALLDAVRAAAC